MVYALVFGLLLPVVVRMNETLGRVIGQSPSAVGVHLIGGIFGLLCVLPFCGPAWFGALARAPWWSFCGGVVGIALVVLANRAIGVLGVAAFTAVTVAIQLVSSGTMDHFGLLGAPVFPMTSGRAVGMLLLAAGAVLVARG